MEDVNADKPGSATVLLDHRNCGVLAVITYYALHMLQLGPNARWDLV